VAVVDGFNGSKQLFFYLLFYYSYVHTRLGKTTLFFNLIFFFAVLGIKPKDLEHAKQVLYYQAVSTVLGFLPHGFTK
jgi:hypothetical protein